MTSADCESGAGDGAGSMWMRSARGPNPKDGFWKQSVTCSAEIITVKWTSRRGSQRHLAACVLTEETMAAAGIDFLPVPGPSTAQWSDWLLSHSWHWNWHVWSFVTITHRREQHPLEVQRRAAPDSREILRATESRAMPCGRRITGRIYWLGPIIYMDVTQHKTRSGDCLWKIERPRPRLVMIWRFLCWHNPIDNPSVLHQIKLKRIKFYTWLPSQMIDEMKSFRLRPNTLYFGWFQPNLHIWVNFHHVQVECWFDIFHLATSSADRWEDELSIGTQHVRLWLISA